MLASKKSTAKEVIFSKACASSAYLVSIAMYTSAVHQAKALAR